LKKADIVEQRLRELYEQRDDLTPAEVLEDARPKGSPLHPLFEWNDKKASEAYRLDQARELIRSVEYVFRTERLTLKAPAYVRDPDADPRSQGYVSVAKVSTDSEISRRILIKELKIVAAALDRANRLAEVFGLQSEVEAMRSQLDLLWRQLAPAA